MRTDDYVSFVLVFYFFLPYFYSYLNQFNNKMVSYTIKLAT